MVWVDVGLRDGGKGSGLCVEEGKSAEGCPIEATVLHRGRFLWIDADLTEKELRVLKSFEKLRDGIAISANCAGGHWIREERLRSGCLLNLRHLAHPFGICRHLFTPIPFRHREEIFLRIRFVHPILPHSNPFRLDTSAEGANRLPSELPREPDSAGPGLPRDSLPDEPEPPPASARRPTRHLGGDGG